MIQFGEKVESEQVLQLLTLALPYYQRSWHSIDEETGLFGTVDPQSFNMRKVGSSSPVIEYVVRPHVQILAILAALHHRDFFPVTIAVSKEDVERMLRQGIKWACDTHLTGTTDVEPFLARRRWGENWRSSLWAASLAMAAFLARSVLDLKLMERVLAVLASEADRFIDVMPPSGCEIDTKVEENAQDAMLLAWAINMLPHHPHTAKWEKSLRRWAMNIATSVHDGADHSEYLGRSVT